MLLGATITGGMLVAGGAATFLLLVFQVLVGLRKIVFKGKLHMKVHKVGGYALVAIGGVHAVMALAFVGII